MGVWSMVMRVLAALFSPPFPPPVLAGNVSGGQAGGAGLTIRANRSGNANDGVDPAGATPARGTRPGHRLGARGVALIQHFESCGRARGDGCFAAYPDPASGGEPWTIGWGSTGADIAKGLVWTQAQCDARFAEDAAALAERVAGLIGDCATDGDQFDALVSFAYNLGVDNLAHSTLLARHRMGDFAGAAGQFARWNRAGGQAMAGLTRRRAAEAALYAGAEMAGESTMRSR